MICQKCKLKNATSHFHSYINGVVNDVYLCSDCAEKFHNEGFNDKNLYGILSSFFETGVLGKTDTKKCECCGITLEKIAKTGRVGCGNCYKVFEKELEPTLLRLHGRTTHVGKTPDDILGESVIPKKDNDSKILELKEKLKSAIEKEEYEAAAEIRDEIKRMEGKE